MVHGFAHKPLITGSWLYVRCIFYMWTRGLAISLAFHSLMTFSLCMKTQVNISNFRTIQKHIAPLTKNSEEFPENYTDTQGLIGKYLNKHSLNFSNLFIMIRVTAYPGNTGCENGIHSRRETSPYEGTLNTLPQHTCSLKNTNCKPVKVLTFSF